MSVYQMALAWKLNLPSLEKLVLLALADAADDDGSNAFPSLRTLASKCSMCDRAVQLKLQALRKTGLVELIGRHPSHQTNVMQLHLGGGAPHAPPRTTCTGGGARHAPYPSVIYNTLSRAREEVYDAYPRKEAKARAMPYIDEAIAAVGKDKLLAAVNRYASVVSKWPKAEHRFIPLAANWFNDARYLDDPATWAIIQCKANNGKKVERPAKVFERYLNEIVLECEKRDNPWEYLDHCEDTYRDVPKIGGQTVVQRARQVWKRKEADPGRTGGERKA